MSLNFYITSILLFVFIGFVVGAENYVDYGDDIPEKTPIENIHELYRLLLQRNALENAGLGEIPLEHLMIRKSQRSPSLRLRFGRSDPHLSLGFLPRPMNAIPPSRFDDK
ncbi:PREDICTED: short neuropeptide F [Eufriesea mexicana]|uniref:short neuropeptide F n=1 Tax=Eufriesea mexicana TaxID=516756 RepID=UPI00083BE28A|nr:PREDICTED: short neuropeptide F [Eufriesea mexicana]XP_017762669.1 PREDICTED: short neuropeptide F [Eufriesea mexicana]